MNLPNLLTVLRIFFVPLLVAVLVQESLRVRIAGLLITNEFLALAIFLAAACTDLLDGYLARRWGQITTLGTLLDPIADKLLISAALISCVQVHLLPAWMTIIIVGREFAVTGLRSIAAAEGFTIKASELGKTKMVAQVAAVSLLLLSVHWPALRPVANWWLWGVVVFALVSAGDYFLKFWRLIDAGIKLRRRRELLLMERKAQKERRRRKRAAAAPWSIVSPFHGSGGRKTRP
ncbi:MAG: CDP-diacylglycerol--glycerol-3-phosphate 3-phosphatidyltransferase [Bryobacteraceae bacterium]|nr:CDP-diacylglycerol--glycerol-3-phosphate 3-phosphatidyltransferase [Bryobacteraceae bacterium]